MSWLAYNFGTLFVKCQWHDDHVDIITGEIFLGRLHIREVERQFI